MKTMVWGFLFCLICTLTQAQDTSLPDSEPQFKALRLAITDLLTTYPQQYQNGPLFLKRLDKITKMAPGRTRDRALGNLRREALLSNPLLDFDRLLMIRRLSQGDQGLPTNWQGNEKLKSTRYTNSIVSFSIAHPISRLHTVFQPKAGYFVGDLDLHFQGTRLLFSMPGQNKRWQVHEMKIDPSTWKTQVAPVVHELPLIPDSDVDNYDACYLPDGNILFTSTATFNGVPCVKGNSHVANIYHLEVKTGNIRRLTFDQDHNWNPTVLNNGRVMYLRWEYSDLPHFVARILFHMNPDGTNQSEYYGSGSYWPNSFFYARAVPDHPTRVVGIVSGHHGTRRAGELVVLDPALGRFEADGVVQRIPGYGKKVEPLILDKLVDQSWPQFLHPYPLSSKYFLVSAKLRPEATWGIYLVDVFDNLLCLRQEQGFNLLEPTPVKKQPLPPVIPDRVDPENKFATIYLEDIYEGQGLKAVPRGTVKKLRLITYHFAYRNMGGQQDPIGLDGPWDIKCVLGTVPVENDGSALFNVPANIPVAFQPLDEEGKAVQLMRSWSTAMPGEMVSCVGCHEKQNTAPTAKTTTAIRQAPSKITPWYGAVRGFSFKREVEPVVDRHCAECHKKAGQTQSQMAEAPTIGNPYMFLRRMVRTPTMEGDMHVLEPYEFHADTTELVRMLETGHHGVNLDAESWDRLITWIDLNTPFHGSWTENVGHQRMANYAERRQDLMQRYAGINGIVEDPSTLQEEKPPEQQAEEMMVVKTGIDEAPEDVTIVKMASKSIQGRRILKLSERHTLPLVCIPEGVFTKGQTRVNITEPFWMATHEISNEIYALFDPHHDSRLESHDYLHFDTTKRGYPLNKARQPVVKVSWERAMTFCQWLSKQTGLDVSLPTESQWEWACRAGSTDPFWYGQGEIDFTKYDNLADGQMWYTSGYKGKRWQWRPAMDHLNDKHRVSAPVGSYQPNPWGLYDMHGNVSEWTSSPYESADLSSTKRIICGGSWSDRPLWAGAAKRWAYREHQKVYNVGFRVMLKNTKEVASLDPSPR
ncbi:SUMF1/EgtB/PvdO family nonheme iron enzyme [Planctomycetota bacterium]